MPKLFFDTRVVPLAVNGAGALEGVLARVSARMGIRPAVVLAGVAGVVGVASVAVLGRFRRRSGAARGTR